MPIVIHEDGSQTEFFKNEGERTLYYMTCGQSFDNEKQLERYAQKCEALVFNYLKRSTPQIFAPRINVTQKERNQWPAILSLHDFFQAMFKISFLMYLKNEDGTSKNQHFGSYQGNDSIVEWIMPNYYFGRNLYLMGQKSTAIIESIIFGMHKNYQDNPETMKFNKLSHISFRSACQDYVAKISYEQGRVDQSTKYTCLPQKDSDFVWLIKNTVAIIFADLALLPVPNGSKKSIKRQ